MGRRLRRTVARNFEILSLLIISRYYVRLFTSSLRKSLFTIMRKCACHADIMLDRKIEAIDDVQLTKAFFDVAKLTISAYQCSPSEAETHDRGGGKRISATNKYSWPSCDNNRDCRFETLSNHRKGLINGFKISRRYHRCHVEF